MSDGAAARIAVSSQAVPPPYRSFASFVAAICAGEAVALRQAYVSYMPLLRDQGRKLDVPKEDRDELASTVLGDVLLHLQNADVPPHDFVRYLVGAFRNRARNRHRDRSLLLATEEQAYGTASDGRQRIVAECHSEYGLRSSALAEPDDAPLQSAIEKLAARSAQLLTADELTIMVGLSHHVPLRELAERAGVPYATARQRLHRLRERFRKLTAQYLQTLDDAERRELQRFFRRAGVELQARSTRAHTQQQTRHDDAAGEGTDDTR